MLLKLSGVILKLWRNVNPVERSLRVWVQNRPRSSLVKSSQRWSIMRLVVRRRCRWVRGFWGSRNLMWRGSILVVVREGL